MATPLGMGTAMAMVRGEMAMALAPVVFPATAMAIWARVVGVQVRAEERARGAALLAPEEAPPREHSFLPTSIATLLVLS